MHLAAVRLGLGDLGLQFLQAVFLLQELDDLDPALFGQGGDAFEDLPLGVGRGLQAGELRGQAFLACLEGQVLLAQPALLQPFLFLEGAQALVVDLGVELEHHLVLLHQLPFLDGDGADDPRCGCLDRPFGPQGLQFAGGGDDLINPGDAGVDDPKAHAADHRPEQGPGPGGGGPVTDLLVLQW